MTTLGIMELNTINDIAADHGWSGEDDDAGGYVLPSSAVHATFLDGTTGPRRCCDPTCRKVIDVAPIVSLGLPYHVACYHRVRAVELN